MHAAVLREHGAAPAYTGHPDPAPGDGRTLVRVTAAPVVPLDLLCASGTSYFGARSLPYVPGVQGVGEVLSSAAFEPGARVFVASSAGMADGDGTLAELVAVDDAGVVPLADVPGDLADTTVAGIGLSGVAAWAALAIRAGLRPGERVVVLGSGGAVGQAGVGAARALGASRVVAVCREGSLERATAAGADAVVPLPDEPDHAGLASALAEALEGEADVVLDPVFGWVAEAAARACGAGARIVNLGGSAGDGASFSSAGLRGRSLSLLGYTNNALTPDQRAATLSAVLTEAAAGRLAVEHDVRPLSEVEQVWSDVAGGAVAARQVLVP
jgi:NADPH:quinone reductase-like Zn-dependent oxidoreductase